MGMQHERQTVADSLRLPASSATTMALSNVAKYWVLTNIFPGSIPQVSINLFTITASYN